MTTMEDLTKTQIVLLTLLVSFITSIATGIITSTLLAQAPQNVTQTIDRVVERTIERVGPTEDGTTVKEVTVIKEGDAIVASIEGSTKAVVRIKDGNQNFYALGAVVSRTGLVVSDKRGFFGGPYTIIFVDGSTLEASLVGASDSLSLVAFKLQANETQLRNLSVLQISKTDPKLGQTVIAMEGRDKNMVAVGRVTSIEQGATSLNTDISPVNEIQGGSLLNLSGELVGLKSSNNDLSLPPSVYTPALQITKFLASYQ